MVSLSIVRRYLDLPHVNGTLVAIVGGGVWLFDQALERSWSGNLKREKPGKVMLPVDALLSIHSST